MTKKRIINCVYLFVICFLYINVSNSQNIPTTWQEQLAFIKNNPCQDQLSDVYYLQLINYTYKGKIKSEDEKSTLINTILSDKSPILLQLPVESYKDTIVLDNKQTIIEKVFPKFEILTIHRAIEIAQSVGEENFIIKAKEDLAKLIQIDFEFVELEWSYKGNKFKSICAVSNENGGIVYDSITSNIVTQSIVTIIGNID